MFIPFNFFFSKSRIIASLFVAAVLAASSAPINEGVHLFFHQNNHAHENIVQANLLLDSHEHAGGDHNVNSDAVRSLTATRISREQIAALSKFTNFSAHSVFEKSKTVLVDVFISQFFYVQDSPPQRVISGCVLRITGRAPPLF